MSLVIAMQQEVDTLKAQMEATQRKVDALTNAIAELSGDAPDPKPKAKRNRKPKAKPEPTPEPKAEAPRSIGEMPVPCPAPAKPVNMVPQQPATKKRGRKFMTDEEKEVVSARMKAYWQAKRAERNA